MIMIAIGIMGTQSQVLADIKAINPKLRSATGTTAPATASATSTTPAATTGSTTVNSAGGTGATIA